MIPDVISKMLHTKRNETKPTRPNQKEFKMRLMACDEWKVI